MQGHSTLNPEAPEWYQHPLVTNNYGSLSDSNHSGVLSSHSERALHEMLELHQQQNAFQQQQNKIVEKLVTREKKSDGASIMVGRTNGVAAHLKASTSLLSISTLYATN